MSKIIEQIQKENIERVAKLKTWDDIPKENWEDWRWQLKNRICDIDALKERILLSAEEEAGIKKSSGMLSMAITPYWASLINPTKTNCPIRRQAIPTVFEHFLDK